MNMRQRFNRPINSTMLFLGFAIICLNLLDAICTLRHLHHGAEEINPFMDMLLRHGDSSFVVAKHLIASGGVIGIVAHQEMPLAKKALSLLTCIYLTLGLYQVALFTIIH